MILVFDIYILRFVVKIKNGILKSFWGPGVLIWGPFWLIWGPFWVSVSGLGKKVAGSS